MTTATAAKPLLTVAREAIPELAYVAAALADVDAQLGAVRSSPPAGESTPIDDAVAAVLAGASPDVAGLGGKVVAARAAHEVANTELETLVRLQQRLRGERLRLHRNGADAALAVLAQELDALLADARQVLPLIDGVENAQAAIDRGVTDTWSAATALASRYDELRRAQATLVTNAKTDAEKSRVHDSPLSGVVELVNTYGSISNYNEIHPPKLAPYTGTKVERSRVSETMTVDTVTTTPSAPQTKPSAAPAQWPTGDTLRDLRWLIGPDAKPWVPSLAELDAAKASAEKPEPTTPRSTVISEARGDALSRKHGGSKPDYRDPIRDAYDDLGRPI